MIPQPQKSDKVMIIELIFNEIEMTAIEVFGKLKTKQ